MRAGKILISEKLLMAWLDYEGGRLRDAGLCDIPGTLEITVEHDDMPELDERVAAMPVHPTYITETAVIKRYRDKG